MHLLIKVITISSLAITLSACTKDGGFFFSNSHSTDTHMPAPTSIQPPPSAITSPYPDNAPSSLSNGSSSEAQAPLNNGASTPQAATTATEPAAPSSNVIPVGKLVPINRGTPTIKNEKKQEPSIINTD